MSSRTERPRLAFATTSAGKLAEGRRLLAGLPLAVVGLANLGLRGDVVEDAPDYPGNARLKARHWAALTGLAVLADDSGLEVDALGGAPGLHSARFGGAGLDDAGRNALLLERLRGVEPEGRGAAFVCVLVLVSAAGKDILVVRGERRGRIASLPRGTQGFGYDPLFELPELGGRTFAELGADIKARESHRGRAFLELRLSLSRSSSLISTLLRGTL